MFSGNPEQKESLLDGASYLSGGACVVFGIDQQMGRAKKIEK